MNGGEVPGPQYTGPAGGTFPRNCVGNYPGSSGGGGKEEEERRRRRVVCVCVCVHVCGYEGCVKVHCICESSFM